MKHSYDVEFYVNVVNVKKILGIALPSLEPEFIVLKLRRGDT